MEERAFLSDEELQRFIASPDVEKELERARNKRHEAHKKHHEWINLDSFKSLTDEDLKQRFIEYYKTGAHRNEFNQINRDKIIKDVPGFRKMACHLLDESVPIKIRLDNILKGKYYVEGVGKGLITSLLLDFKPEEYCVWNNSVAMGLARLGRLPTITKGEKDSETYLKIIKAHKQIRDIFPKPYNNFIDVNYFLHLVAKESINPPSEPTPTENDGAVDKQMTSQVEFTMEKILEDFIAGNFASVFPNLELYQDEESKGQQYPTAVGPIDFLARDKDAGNLVVIELKLDRSSDCAVGQILRYMQWVEENLAGENKVRGIIVAKEQDEKIKYALRRVPDVEFYSYRVEFEVEKANK